MTLLMCWLRVKEMLSDKRGQGMVEYVLIIAFVAVLLIATLTGLSTSIAAKFTQIITALTPGS